MEKIIIIKNTGEQDIWTGMTIASGASYTPEAAELPKWQSDLKVFQDISSGILVINNGSEDIVNALDGYGYLMGSVVTVKADESDKTPVQGATKVAVYKAEGSSTIMVTPDFCDPTTWYEHSFQVTQETLTSSDNLMYSSTHTKWIDMIHGKVYMEDQYTIDNVPFIHGGLPKYKVHVYVAGVEKTEDTDFTIDYLDGRINFSEAVIGEVKADYYYATNNEYCIIPNAGKILNIEHSELQFTTDMEITSPIYFDVYVYNPSDLPNKILYSRTVYKNLKDIINAANLGTGYIPALAGLDKEVCVFPFEYATLKTLKSSQGAELRISTKDSLPFGGTWGTCTFIMFSQDEV